MKDSKMIAIAAILVVCYLTVVISIDTCKMKTMLSQIKETNDFKTILKEKDSIYVEKIYYDNTKGYEYYEQKENQVVYEAKTKDEFINIENAVVYTKTNEDDVKIDVSFNDNIYDLPLLINELQYKEDKILNQPKIEDEHIVLTTKIENEDGGMIKRTFYFNKETYYLTKIIDENFDNTYNFISSVTSIYNYGQKNIMTKEAVIAAAGDNSINLYLIKNTETNKEIARFVKASTNCKYIKATTWDKENYNFKLSFDNTENAYEEILSLENKVDGQVLIYVTG